MMAKDPTAKAVDDLIAKAVAAMARYGVSDPYDPRLSREDFTALHKELKRLKPRRPRSGKYTPQDDLRILTRLGAKEGEPGGAEQEAEVLFEEMNAEGHTVQSAEALRQHYQKLKKQMLEAVDKFEQEHGIDGV